MVLWKKKKIKKKKRQTRLSAANQKRQFLPRRSKRVRAGDKSVVKINCFFSFFSVCPNPENECGLADTRKGRSCFTTARRSPRQRKNKNNYYQETHDWTVARRGGVVTEVCVWNSKAAPDATITRVITYPRTDGVFVKN